MSSTQPIYDIKRTMEIWTSGLYSKEEFEKNPAPIFKRHNAVMHAQILHELLEPSVSNTSSLLDGYKKSINDKLIWRDMIRTQGSPSNIRMKAWRERQIRRCILELGESQNNVITHPPIAFELTKGCSINCWFCALNAGSLTKVFKYTPENAKLWQGVLRTSLDIIGSAACWGTSYWATEPLDNRRYEFFCNDFHSILGMYPQTTTAAPLRNIERTKKILYDSYEKGCKVNRFSIHSGEQLLEVHQNFSAEELAHTELILENEEADTIMVRSGRMYDLKNNMPEKAEIEDRRTLASFYKQNPDLSEQFEETVLNTSHLGFNDRTEGAKSRLCVNIPATTACVSGFLIKMPDRSVELISPCAADDTWPLGYMIFDHASFESSEQLQEIMEAMVNKHMPDTIEVSQDVSLTPRFHFECLEDGFKLSSVFGSVSFVREDMGDYVRHVGQLLHAGSKKAGEIALECFYLFGKPEQTTITLINEVYKHGLLNEINFKKQWGAYA